MNTPKIVTLSDELKSLQQKWLAAHRQDQDLIYSQEFGPRFAPLFAQLPLHGWEGKPPSFQALISVLGFSWQPVALMAAWLQPQFILLLGTRDSCEVSLAGEPVKKIIARIANVPESSILVRQVDDPEELGIYREIRKFVDDHKLGPHEMVIDPTGGKKSMSASAALAGYLLGAWLVYVDYQEYHPQKRIPIAGTEYPRLMHNPLEEFGDLEKQRIKEAIGRGSFEEARLLAEALSSRLYDAREAEAIALYAATYGAWHHFKFSEAHSYLQQLKSHLEKFGRKGKWHWSASLLNSVVLQEPVIQELANLTTRVCANQKPSILAEGMPLVLNHLAAAERALFHHQTSTAMLLTYATLERYIDLCLWVSFSLDDENPDFSKLSLNIRSFHESGKIMHGKAYEKREPAGSISLSLGAQLLATLSPDVLPKNYLGRIKGMMTKRNRCEFEHGLCPQAISHDDVKYSLHMVQEIIALAMSSLNGDLNQELQRYRFPGL